LLLASRDGVSCAPQLAHVSRTMHKPPSLFASSIDCISELLAAAPGPDDD
jgi:hypothetical protein